MTSSADIFPQFREFERFTTACMNAFVGPTTGRYLERLAGALAERGRAGEAARDDVQRRRRVARRRLREKPVTLLLSGPAAGVLGGLWAGQTSGRERLITFDMGGTSADIGIVTERGISEASARDTWVAGYPLLVPMIDIHTIGAGGGSIAYVDEGGAFRVGPRSAGADPGPACYGQGGDEPTITDANVVLGRIDPDRFLGGEMTLDRRARRGSRAAARRPARARPARGGGGDRHDRQREHGAARSARGRSRRATTRASSRSSPSAAPARCTRPRSPSRSASPR